MTEQKRKHAEASCLMDYKCQDCGRKELIWNSRDGVTPFAIGCQDPECQGAMNHINWSMDRPFDSLPKDADRVVVDMTEHDAREIAEKRLHLFREQANRPPEVSVEELATNIYQNGGQPRIVSVEEYKRRAGIEEPEPETPFDVEFIVECLRDLATLQDDGTVDPAGMYSPQAIRDQADALEGTISIIHGELEETEPDPDDFAKFWRFDDFGQVVVAIIGPSVKVFYQPRIPGILPVELDLLALGCSSGDDIAPVSARRVFSDLNRERVLEILHKAEAAILSETTSRATKH